MTATVYGLDNKVSKSGDTMTGNLTVPSLNVTGALNANPTFQGGLTPWTLAVGASFTQSSSFAYPGQTYSARLVPDGVSPVIYAQSEQIPCTANTAYTAQSWVYCPTGYSPGGGNGFTVGVNWYDATNIYISSSTSYVSVGAAAWTPFVAPYTSPSNAASFIIVPALNATPAGTGIIYLYNTCVAAASMQDLASVVVQALQMPATGKSGYVLTADAYGNLTLQAATGGPSLPLSIANGGTGQATQQAAMDALAGAVTTGDFLRGNGTHVVMAALSSGDIPNNAANTSGNATTATTATSATTATTAGSCSGNAATATNLAGGATFPAYTAPKVVTLTDASTVTVNAASGNDFRLLMTSGVGATRALGAPSSPVDGQRIDFMVTQDSAGSRLLTYNSAYEFSTSLASPTLSTAANAVDILGFIYNTAKTKWLFVAFLSGF